jgi:hypothetical protein
MHLGHVLICITCSGEHQTAYLTRDIWFTLYFWLRRAMGGNVSLQLAPSPKLKTAEVASKDTPVILDSHVLDDSVLGVENTLAAVAFEG